jgi:hypothetical protein
MATGGYSARLYHSAVDGLVISAENDRQNLITRRQIPSIRYPMMSSSMRTSYIPPQSYPIHSNVLRSSTGSILHRVPNPQMLPTRMFRPTNNVRWDSPINMVDFKSRPMINPNKTFQHPMMFPPRAKLARSESLQIPNTNNEIMQKAKLDARHFCGLAPIQENKPTIREIPSFRMSVPIIR